MARQISNRTIAIDGVDIFYREAGDKANPSLLLLHGFPTSSVMFKNLMIALSDRFHLIAPDYPGFGFSAFPDRNSFEYSFKNISAYINRFTEAIKLRSFTVYLHDYGCPIGLRLCVNHPEKIERIIVQNGNAYEEGIGPQWDETKEYWQNPTEEKKEKVAAFLSEEGTKMQYAAGLPKELLTNVSPELWMLDWDLMKRRGNIDMQFELNCDFKSNIDMFPEFQEYFRTHQPPALVIWGKYDVFFGVEEAHCYKRDLPNAQVYIVDGGHMALETNFDEVLELINNFLVSQNDTSTVVPSADASGDTAAHYDQFLGPLFFEPYAIEVVKRMDPTQVSIALEIAAGTGRVTRHIRESIPTPAKLIASDISEDMLGEAKKKLSHLDIEWQNIDAQQLPFSDNSIDLVVCCFGYMFVPDKPKAFAEAYRVLRPGGMFLITTWDRLDQNAASYTARSIAKEYLEEPLPESYNLATSMSDETVIEQLLQDAGFSKITIEKVKHFSVSPSAKEAAYGLVEGGAIYKEIKKRNPAWIAEIKIKVEKELAEKFGAAPMIAPISAVISQAWK